MACQHIALTPPVLNSTVRRPASETIGITMNYSQFKGALYRIWCGLNRLGDSGAKVL